MDNLGSVLSHARAEEALAASLSSIRSLSLRNCSGHPAARHLVLVLERCLEYGRRQGRQYVERLAAYVTKSMFASGGYNHRLAGFRGSEFAFDPYFGFAL